MVSKKAARKRKRRSVARRRRVPFDELPEEADPDEAVALIAEILAGLTGMARRHQLDVLTHLLSMAQLEAEEHVLLRSRGKLT
jgi:hypothetical protein